MLFTRVAKANFNIRLRLARLKKFTPTENCFFRYFRWKTAVFELLLFLQRFGEAEIFDWRIEVLNCLARKFRFKTRWSACRQQERIDSKTTDGYPDQDAIKFLKFKSLIWGYLNLQNISYDSPNCNGNWEFFSLLLNRPVSFRRCLTGTSSQTGWLYYSIYRRNFRSIG